MTAEVDGGALTPSIKKLIGVPDRIFEARIPSKDTLKVSTVSPWMKTQSGSGLARSKPFSVVQLTVPGEVEVET